MLDAIALGVLAGKQAVIDEIRRERFLQRLQVARGLRLQEAAHQGLVLLSGRHGVCSLQPSCAMESPYRSRIRRRLAVPFESIPRLLHGAQRFSPAWIRPDALAATYRAVDQSAMN